MTVCRNGADVYYLHEGESASRECNNLVHGHLRACIRKARSQSLSGVYTHACTSGNKRLSEWNLFLCEAAEI